MKGFLKMAKTKWYLPRVYISGPMSGYKDLNFPAFFEAERALKARGFKVVNPARNRKCKDWKGYLKKDIAKLVKCQYIHLLPRWMHSRGASLEWRIARELNIEEVKL